MLSIRGFLTLFLACFISFSARAEDEKSLFNMPEDPGKTEIYLITVGLGDQIYSRFGHTILRVDDLEAGTVQLLNWGMFDFNDPNFYTNFFRGLLTYRMGKDNFVATIRQYRDYEKRSMWQQKINLTAEQKAQILQRVHINGMPENVRYRYQYLFNNCSTVLRDYFDELFDGAMKKHFQAEHVQLKFRDYIYGALNYPPIVAFFLDVIMNSRIDGPISKWEEMFLPDKMSQYLAEFPSAVKDDAGNRLPFLGKSEILIENPQYPSSIIEGHWVFFSLFICIFIWLGVLFGKGFGRVLQCRISGSKPSLFLQVILRLFALASLIFVTFALVFALTMSLSWVFSEHMDLHHNVNLMLFWPTDLVLLIPIFCLLVRGWLPDWPRFWRFVKTYCDLHLLFALVFFIIFVAGISDQNIKRVVQFILPVQILCYGMLAKLIKVMRLH